MSIIVTGGAGFIGSNFILDWVKEIDELVINIDLITYSGNIDNLSNIQKSNNLNFIKGDIKNKDLLKKFIIVINQELLLILQHNHMLIDQLVAQRSLFIQIF